MEETKKWFGEEVIKPLCVQRVKELYPSINLPKSAKPLQS
jgi:hypothetical protein